ncbi:endonuclease/exonuclease/phosphatase family protein [Planococcus maritimus]|uniref:endonuclease/exonuclease/phosphatase family protein n=1 Tax=Planococcus maritimus TaxID=192421 RepID=UPI00079983BD|nr:endonuclease/exonuclease/phosphatase family protein [Planococcus maritimus]KYG58432.1 endonuclease [Planococcus maritimus]
MKLLTLNCHAWHEESQMEKIRYLAQAIAEKQYDVIALQEVNQSIDGKAERIVKHDNYAQVLLQELEQLGVTGYSIVWGFSHLVYGRYEEGSVILTRHPVIEEHSFFVSQSTDKHSPKTRKIVGATIQYAGQPITFYSCHMGWWLDPIEPFQYQADQLLEHMKKEGHTFLLGDFNNDASLDQQGYAYLLKNGLHDTYTLAEEKDAGITVKGKITGWSDNKQDLRIDLILSTEPVAVKSSKVIFNSDNKPLVSDHFGVEVHVEMK